jgi:hypothetical protein
MGRNRVFGVGVGVGMTSLAELDETQGSTRTFSANRRFGR